MLKIFYLYYWIVLDGLKLFLKFYFLFLNINNYYYIFVRYLLNVVFVRVYGSFEEYEDYVFLILLKDYLMKSENNYFV